MNVSCHNYIKCGKISHMVYAKRNFGLDIIRACAIIMVLMAHIAPLMKSHLFTYNFLYHAGLYGVELFFVLSGYLIGLIFLRKVLPVLSVQRIITFYIRRWLRTLPLYFIILAILIILTNIDQKKIIYHPYHFVFIQNFLPTEANFFAVAWSLSIEEWFYLLLPLVFIPVTKKAHKTKTIAILLLLIISVIILMRILYVAKYQPTFDLGIRKFIPLRFDSLLIGVLAAHIKLYYQGIYKSLLNTKLIIITFFSLGMYYLWYVNIMMKQGISYFDNSFLVRSFSWPLISMSMAFVILYFEKSIFINNSIKKISVLYILFTRISLYSYSLYLIHYDIYQYFYLYLHSNNAFLNVIIPTFIIFFLSVLIYRYIESPILRRRNRLFIQKKI